MNITLKQVSNMHKLRTVADLQCDELVQITALAGQRVSYQLCLICDARVSAEIRVGSRLLEHIRLFEVKNAVMDRPYMDDGRYEVSREEEYLAHEPGLMPDVLVPVGDQNSRICIGNGNLKTLWIRLDVPRDCAPGSYDIRISYHISPFSALEKVETVSRRLTVEVLPAVLPAQELIYTRWLHVDCIADYHCVQVYSEEHWQLIDRYIAAAADTGINMILVPIHTPPLDTAIGHYRTCVQLVDIEKKGEEYSFGFEKFHRFIEICKKNGIRYFEMAHLFSQWGAASAPNIRVTEKGVTDYLFGWQVPATSDFYIGFLKQYIGAICRELERAGIAENTYFHISDEPTLDSLEQYKLAHDLVRPILRGSKIMDALSNVEFCDRGLVDCPVTATNRMEPFMTRTVPDQWVYYCAAQQEKVSNCLLSMPSCRTRILGFQMYRHGIKGFLHWAFNYYNSPVSLYPINPYATTSAEGNWGSGDPFIVYPGQEGVYPSVRGEVFYEALQDVRICRALEAKIGRAAVERMIDTAAGRVLTFDRYPRGAAWQEELRNAMLKGIADMA